MASRKDMRRTDLVIPYVEPPSEKESDFTGTLSSTMPMAAMFMRNKLLGWFSLATALLNWLSETPSQKNNSNATPGYLSFAMAVLAVGVTYLPLFLPPPVIMQTPGTGTGTGAPAAVPP